MTGPQYLTKRQRDVLAFIESFIEENKYSPSLEEICAGVGLSSIATVHVHLRNLEEKKAIRRSWNRSRAIELIPQPQGRGGSSVPRGLVELPLLGVVTAGAPMEAIETPETIHAPEEFVRSEETFVLRVRGESMIDEHICDGDLIIVERRQSAESGQTVVALVNGDETTVKKYYQENPALVRLQPANAAMEPLFIPTDSCAIQGIVIGLMRKY